MTFTMVVTYQITGRTYEVEIEDFVVPSVDDAGEVELARFVTVSLPTGTDVVTFDTFLTEVAIERGLTLPRAARWVEDRAMERIAYEQDVAFDERGF